MRNGSPLLADWNVRKAGRNLNPSIQVIVDDELSQWVLPGFGVEHGIDDADEADQEEEEQKEYNPPAAADASSNSNSNAN